MKKVFHYMVGSFVIGIVISVIAAEILKVASYVIPTIFFVVPLIGIINKCVDKFNFKVVRNKFINGAINKFKKTILVHVEFWFAIGIGFLFNIDVILHYIGSILKYGFFSFVIANIVWATISIVVRIVKKDNVPNYFQLWNAGY